jgi:hypothetical protein
MSQGAQVIIKDAVLIETTSANGIEISNSGGTQVSFLPGAGGLAIATGSGGGFVAASGVTLALTGANNSISTGTGTGLSLDLNDVAANMNFRSISTNGANGIYLSHVGPGTITVTGTGAPASGGTLQNTVGDAILVNSSAVNLDLSSMVVRNPGQHGMEFTQVGNTTTLRNLQFLDWATPGTSAIRIANNGPSMTLNVKDTAFDGTSTSDDGIHDESAGSSGVVLVVDRSSFTDIGGDAIDASVTLGTNPQGTERVTVTNSTFTSSAGGGILLRPGGANGYFATIEGNVFDNLRQAGGTQGVVSLTHQSGDAHLTVKGNTFTRVGGGSAIEMNVGLGRLFLDVNANSIDSLGPAASAAIYVSFENNIPAGPRGGVTIRDNSIGQTGPLWTGGDNAGSAILIQAVNGVSGLAAITGNTISGNTTGDLVLLRSLNLASLGVTASGNTLTDTSGARSEIAASVGDLLAGAETLSVSLSGNGTATGALTIGLARQGNGVLNVAEAGPAALSGANGGATVNVSGSPAYGQAAPSLPTLPSLPLLAAPDGLLPAGTPALLDGDALQLLLAAAVTRWGLLAADAMLELTREPIALAIADLPGTVLAQASGRLILVDVDAAGHGWFVDPTPLDDAEFGGGGHGLQADLASGAAGHMDLLTVLMHEIGHAIGFGDDYQPLHAFDVMHSLLAPGERHVPQVLIGVPAMAPWEAGLGA